MAVLIVKQGKQRAGWRLTDSIDIGRLPQNDLAIDAQGVSREHARIVVDGEVCTIEDLGSTNGTWVNGKKVEQPRTLIAGDEIAIGKIRLIYLDQDTLPAGLSQLKSRNKQKQIVFRCGHCHAVLQSPLGRAGQKGKCAGCGTRFVVPLTSGEIAEQADETKPAPALAPGPASDGFSTGDLALDFAVATKPGAGPAVAWMQPEDEAAEPVEPVEATVNRDGIDLDNSDRIANAPDMGVADSTGPVDVAPFAGAATWSDDHVAQDEDCIDIAADGAVSSGATAMGFDFDVMVDVDDPPTGIEYRDVTRSVADFDVKTEPFDCERTAPSPTAPVPFDDVPSSDRLATDAQMMLGVCHDDRDEPFAPARQPDEYSVPGHDDAWLEVAQDTSVYVRDAVDVGAQRGDAGRPHDEPQGICDPLTNDQHDAKEENLVAVPHARTSDGAEHLAEAPIERDHRQDDAQADGGHVHESDWWHDAAVVLEHDDDKPAHDPIMATLQRSASRRGSNAGLVGRVQRHAARRAHLASPAATARFMGLVADDPVAVSSAVCDASARGIDNDVVAEPTVKPAPVPVPAPQTEAVSTAVPQTSTPDVTPAPAPVPQTEAVSTASPKTSVLPLTELAPSEQAAATDAIQSRRRESNQTPSLSKQDLDVPDAAIDQEIDNSHLIDWLDAPPTAADASTVTAAACFTRTNIWKADADDEASGDVDVTLAEIDTPWEKVLLIAAIIAMVVGLIMFGVPSAIALACTVRFRRRDRDLCLTNAMFAMVVCLNIVGLLAGALVSWWLFMR
jgi:hypothetical protein